MKGQLDGKKLHLILQVNDDVPREVIGDKFKIEHVLANFLSNAVKFSEENSTLWIKVALLDKASTSIKFSVVDQGIYSIPNIYICMYCTHIHIWYGR